MIAPASWPQPWDNEMSLSGLEELNPADFVVTWGKADPKEVLERELSVLACESRELEHRCESALAECRKIHEGRDAPEQLNQWMDEVGQ